MSTKLVINSMRTLSEALEQIATLWRKDKYLVLSIRIGRDRSIEQNRLWRAMYVRIAEVTSMGTPDDVWHYCKLMLGVPILSRDSEQFESMWLRYFGHLDYEEQLRLMGPNKLFGPEGFKVTSLFGTKQGSEYTQRICDHFAPYSVLFDDLLRDAA